MTIYCLCLSQFNIKFQVYILYKESKEERFFMKNPRKRFSVEPDLNQRPMDNYQKHLQSTALPTELSTVKVPY